MNSQVIFSTSPSRWMRIAVLNLMIVALVGVFNRYKLSYALPQIDFKNLVNSHSHFAFTAWISTALFAIIVAFFLSPEKQESKEYAWLFWLNQITAYGMLISFLLEDYGTISIIFSSASMLVLYAYSIFLWKDTRKNSNLLSIKTLRIALICLVLSSLGPYALIVMKSTHIFNLIYYNNAIYWYLHFQYNGWFSFGVFSIAIHAFEKSLTEKQYSKFKTFINLMILALLPTYLISMLWIDPALWVFVVAGIGGFLQLIAVFFLWHEVLEKKSDVKRTIKEPGGLLLLIAFLSISIKLVLQFFCIFPELNKFVFGHRPVIIGYLHLVFIGFVSFFIIGTCIRHGVMSYRKKIAGLGLIIFLLGFLVTEFALLMDGIDLILMTVIPGLQLILYVAAIVMFAGIVLFAIPQEKFQIHFHHKK